MDPKQMRRRPLEKEEDIARPDRLEAIAMRRIVVEMGYWLSPFMKDHPLPVLSEWERTCDLTKLNHKPAAMVPQTRMSVGVSVLNRLDEHLPKNKNPSTTTNQHDNNVNRRALASWERLTDAERTSIEKQKEQRKRNEVAEKTARMRQTEAELRDQLRSEDQETKEQREARQKEARERAPAKAQPEKAAKAKPIEVKRVKTRTDASRLADAERKRRKRAEAAALLPPKPPPMTPEERKAKKNEAERRRKAAQRERDKAKPKVEAPKEKPALDLSFKGKQVDPLELAYAIPLDALVENYINRKASVVMAKHKRNGTPADLEAVKAAQHLLLDKQLQKNPAYLYEERARVIQHNRVTAIIDRELTRGSITREEAPRIRLELSPFGERKKQLATMSEADRRAERAAYKRKKRAEAKENQ